MSKNSFRAFPPVLTYKTFSCFALPGGRLLFLALFFCSFFILYPASPPAFAHIEGDATPDAIAKMEYLILLEFEPDNIDVRNKLAMVFLRLNKLPEAADQFGEVLQREPANFNAIDGMGLVFGRQQKYGEALAQFDKAITIDPKDAMVYYHRARVLEALDRLEEAIENYEKALVLFPKIGDSKAEKLKKEVSGALQTLRDRITAEAFSN